MRGIVRYMILDGMKVDLRKLDFLARITRSHVSICNMGKKMWFELQCFKDPTFLPRKHWRTPHLYATCQSFRKLRSLLFPISFFFSSTNISSFFSLVSCHMVLRLHNSMASFPRLIPICQRSSENTIMLSLTLVTADTAWAVNSIMRSSFSFSYPFTPTGVA